MNNELDLLMAEVLTRPQDASRDRRLAALLRAASPEERQGRLDELLEKKCHSALVILRSVGDAQTCGALLARHLPKADASSVKLLLRLGVDVVGEKKLVPLLIDASQVPLFWEYAAYWLPSMVSKETWAILRNLRERQAPPTPDSPRSTPRG